MKKNGKKIAIVHSDKARELLIQAAKSLFGKKGFDGVSVREIADAADVNFSLIRYYFGDKVGIYRACLDLYGNTRLSSAVRILQPVASVEEFKVRLKIMIQEIIDSLQQDPDLSRMMMREMESEEPIAADVIRTTLVKMAEAFVHFFTSAQKKGILRKDINPLFLTQIIQMTLSHLVLTDRARGQFFDMSIKNSLSKAVLVESLHMLLLNGVLERPSGRKS